MGRPLSRRCPAAASPPAVCPAAVPPCRRAAVPPCRRAAVPPCHTPHAARRTRTPHAVRHAGHRPHTTPARRDHLHPGAHLACLLARCTALAAQAKGYTSIADFRGKLRDDPDAAAGCLSGRTANGRSCSRRPHVAPEHIAAANAKASLQVGTGPHLTPRVPTPRARAFVGHAPGASGRPLLGRPTHSVRPLRVAICWCSTQALQMCRWSILRRSRPATLRLARSWRRSSSRPLKISASSHSSTTACQSSSTDEPSRPRRAFSLVSPRRRRRSERAP